VFSAAWNTERLDGDRSRTVEVQSGSCGRESSVSLAEAPFRRSTADPEEARPGPAPGPRGGAT
jgi:hypothetical protein